jgi:spermidine dehydrogenase
MSIDRDLGESRPIPRRDFVQGALIGAATTLTLPFLEACAPQPRVAEAPNAALAGPQDLPGYYPPSLTGLRGSHPGSFETAHALRDGQRMPSATDTQETYDLAIVGGGISGLAAAHFFRVRTSRATRILILDNHDDFGGHARRNEFALDGRVQLLNAGTVDIDSPRPYSPVSQQLLRELGIDTGRLSRAIEDRGFYRRHGLESGVFFDRETFGTDRLVVGASRRSARTWLADSPLSERARADIERIEEGSIDFLPGLTAAEKKDRLSRISYRDFLRDLVKADPAAIAFYQAWSHGEWAVGIDAVSALDCWGFGAPGFRGLSLPRTSTARMGYTASGYIDTGGSAKLHFPDGNATIARLLVRSLIPAAVPGRSVDDVVMARVDYGRLDRPDSSVRLRLGSIVTAVRHTGNPESARDVEVTYMRGEGVFRVRARRCVLACWNMMIPYLCPELPEPQKAALHRLVKSPLVETSVALRNWQAFKKLGVYDIYAPGSYHTTVFLNPKVEIGGYRSPRSPDEPILVRMERTPCQPGLPEHEQNRIGRAEILATPFATYERNIREQLARMLAAGGFDPARDIEAITVNRWPHGYAPEYNVLFEEVVPDAERPHIIGRARFGHIAIANSDAGAAAYTDSAIDQAHRAVDELLSANL